MKRLMGPFFIPLLIFSLSASRYATGYADSDELITAAAHFSVTHPSGYPFAVLILGIWIRLLPFLTPAHAANLFASVLHAISTLILYRSIMLILKTFFPSSQSSTYHHLHLVSLISVLTLAFSGTYWLYSAVIEVVPFTDLFVSLIVYSALRWYTTHPHNFSRRWFFLTFFWVGLGLSHIHSVVLLVPGLLIMLMYHFRQSPRPSIRLVISGIGIGLLTFILPLVVLFAFNLRRQPVSWYFQPTPKGLIDFVFRKDYTGYFLEEDKFRTPYLQNLQNKFLSSQPRYFHLLVSQFGLPLLLIALVGGAVLIRSRSNMALSLIGLYIITGPVFAGIMGIPDSGQIQTDTLLKVGVLERQMTISYLFLIVLYACGLYTLVNIASHLRHSKFWLPLLSVIPMIYLGWIIYRHCPMGLQTNNNLVSVYAHHMLNSVPPNSVILCAGDTSCFSLLHASTVERFRPDVLVLSKNTKLTYWYTTTHPETYPYLYDQNPDYYASLIAWNVAKRPTFVTLPDSYYTDYIGLAGNPLFMQPSGLLFRITNKPLSSIDLISPPPLIQLFHHQPPSTFDHFKVGLKAYFSGIYNLAGLLYAQADVNNLAKDYLEQSLTLNPQNPLPLNWLGLLASDRLSPTTDQPLTAGIYLDQAAQSLTEGDSDQAFRLARKAAYVQPGDAQPHLFIADLMLRSKYLDRARLEAQQALIFDPQNPTAIKILSEL